MQNHRRDEPDSVPRSDVPVDGGEPHDPGGDPGRGDETLLFRLELAVGSAGPGLGTGVHVALSFEKSSGGADVQNAEAVRELPGAPNGQPQKRLEVFQLGGDLRGAGGEPSVSRAPDEGDSGARRSAKALGDPVADLSKLEIADGGLPPFEWESGRAPLRRRVQPFDERGADEARAEQGDRTAGPGSGRLEKDHRHHPFSAQSRSAASTVRSTTKNVGLPRARATRLAVSSTRIPERSEISPPKKEMRITSDTHPRASIALGRNSL